MALQAEKQKPAKRVARSAGFAIRSPQGIGEPHDIAPRGSKHLSYVPICPATGRRQDQVAKHRRRTVTRAT